VRSRLAPVVKVAGTLKAHLAGLLNYFTHRICLRLSPLRSGCNAVSEGLNSTIQKLKANARGFRNFANFRTRILFYLGKLSLTPQTHSSV
jgi:transposase